MTNKIRYHTVLFIMVMVLAACSQDSALVIVEEGYIRGLPPTVSNTSAYMKITNNSDGVLVFMGAKTSIANSVTLHLTENDNGMMSMAHVMSMSIEPQQEVILESGGAHLMLMELTEPIQAGDMVELVLQFEGGFEYQVSLPVRSVLEE